MNATVYIEKCRLGITAEALRSGDVLQTTTNMRLSEKGPSLALADPTMLQRSDKEAQACTWATKRKAESHTTYIKGTVYNKIRCNMNLQPGEERRCKSVPANIKMALGAS